MAVRRKRFEVKNKGGKAKVKLIGDISWWRNSSEEFTRLIDQLLDDGVTDVNLYINSPGGDMFTGNEIANQFERFTGHKEASLGALCASAATSITTVFDKIKCARNISYMIHDPMTSPFIQHEEDFDSNKKLYQNLRNNAIKEYAKLTKRIKGEDGGLSEEEVSDMMKKTTWMNAEELLEKGFVHEINDEDDSYIPDDAQDVANRMKFTLPETVLNKLVDLDDSQEEKVEDDEPKPTKESNTNQSKMKNFILTFLATFGVVNVNDQSSEGDIFAALKNFVNQKVDALNSVIDQLKTYEGFQFNADNLLQSVKDFVKLKDDKINNLQSQLDKIEEDKLAAVFDIAKNQKGFTEKQVEALKNMAKNSTVEEVVAFLEQSSDVRSLSNSIQKDGANNSSTMSHAINSRLAGIKSNLQTSNK